MDVNFNEMQNSKLPDINYSKRLEEINKSLKEMGMEDEYLSNEEAVSIFDEMKKDSNGNVSADDFALALAQQYDSSIKDLDDLDKNYYYALTGIAFADGNGNSMSLEDLELFQKEIKKYQEQQTSENTSATRNDQDVLEGLPDYFKQRNKDTASNRIKVDNAGNYYVTVDAFNKNKSENIDCYSRLISNVYGYSYDSQEGQKLMEALTEANPDLANGMLIGQRINLVDANEVLNIAPKNEPQAKTYEDYSEQFNQEVDDNSLTTMLNDENLSRNEKIELLAKAKTNNPEIVEQYLKNDDSFYVNEFVDMVADTKYSVDDILSFRDKYNEIQGEDETLNVGSLYANFLRSYVSLFEKAAESKELNKLEEPTSLADHIKQSSHLDNDEKSELLKRITVATGYFVHL